MHLKSKVSKELKNGIEVLVGQVVFKGCGMGPWLVLVSPYFRENVVTSEMVKYTDEVLNFKYLAPLY